MTRRTIGSLEKNDVQGKGLRATRGTGTQLPRADAVRLAASRAVDFLVRVMRWTGRIAVRSTKAGGANQPRRSRVRPILGALRMHPVPPHLIGSAGDPLADSVFSLRSHSIDPLSTSDSPTSAQDAEAR